MQSEVGIRQLNDNPPMQPSGDTRMSEEVSELDDTVMDNLTDLLAFMGPGDGNQVKSV